MFWKRIGFPVNPDYSSGIPPRPPGPLPSLRPPGMPPGPITSLRPPGVPPQPPGVPSGDPFKGRPLGRVLVKMGKVTREQVIEALVYQRKHGGLVGEAMVKLGFVQPADVHAALAGQRGERP